MANLSYIYAISCQGKLIYIGRSISIERRIAEHIDMIGKAGLKSKQPYRSLFTLLKSGKVLYFSIIEECPISIASQREAHYIRQYSMTEPLINIVSNSHCNNSQCANENYQQDDRFLRSLEVTTGLLDAYFNREYYHKAVISDIHRHI
jgi:hypothetical protein